MGILGVSTTSGRGFFKLSSTHIQTSRQTDRHGDSMTESAQWADSVKIMPTKDTESLKVCG